MVEAVLKIHQVGNSLEFLVILGSLDTVAHLTQFPFRWLKWLKVQGVPHLHSFHYRESHYRDFWIMYVQVGDPLQSH